MNLPPALATHCAEFIGSPIRETSFVGGGNISEARLLKTNQGSFFLKYRSGQEASALFEAEARGLNLLKKTKAVRVPEVLAYGSVGAHGFLLMEYIEKGWTDNGFWDQFGASVATLHHTVGPSFGLSHDNFIGCLPQSNAIRDSWIDFFRDNRLAPQFKMAFDAGLLTRNDRKALKALYKALPEILTDEPPSLIHGDLWSGNFLVSANGEPVLIDPAVYFGHREMDMAMNRLFGGFDWHFYRSYEEVFPIPPGLEERLPIYQLYYLLVHVNLFGTGYVGAVRNTLSPFFA